MARAGADRPSAQAPVRAECAGGRRGCLQHRPAAVGLWLRFWVRGRKGLQDLNVVHAHAAQPEPGTLPERQPAILPLLLPTGAMRPSYSYTCTM